MLSWTMENTVLAGRLKSIIGSAVMQRRRGTLNCTASQIGPHFSGAGILLAPNLRKIDSRGETLKGSLFSSKIAGQSHKPEVLSVHYTSNRQQEHSYCFSETNLTNKSKSRRMDKLSFNSVGKGRHQPTKLGHPVLAH